MRKLICNKAGTEGFICESCPHSKPHYKEECTCDDTVSCIALDGETEISVVCIPTEDVQFNTIKENKKLLDTLQWTLERVIAMQRINPTIAGKVIINKLEHALSDCELAEVLQ